MLMNTNIKFNFLANSFYSTFLLLCTTYSAPLCANNNLYRKEPISPIPLKVISNNAKTELGKSLFFDKRLSKNNTIACASCHQLDNGGDDNEAKGFSSLTCMHVINTPSIFNARFNFRQNWDGSAENLTQQVDMVINSRHEFNNSWNSIMTILSQDAKTRSRFDQIYANGITKDNIIDAIVEFEKTLITPNSRFDRYLRLEDNVLSEEEIEGYALFKELGCISCHQGRNVGGNLFQKFGIFYNYIAERGEITKNDYGKFNESGREIDKFFFKVPSLRNISITAPYLHDGSAETIEDVIAIMGKTQLGRTLTKDEIHLIKIFLNTLTGEYNHKSLSAAS